MILTRLKSFKDITKFYCTHYMTDVFLLYLYQECNRCVISCLKYDDVCEFTTLLKCTSIFRNYLLVNYNLDSGLLDYVEYFCEINGCKKDDLLFDVEKK